MRRPSPSCCRRGRRRDAFARDEAPAGRPVPRRAGLACAAGPRRRAARPGDSLAVWRGPAGTRLAGSDPGRTERRPSATPARAPRPWCRPSPRPSRQGVVRFPRHRALLAPSRCVATGGPGPGRAMRPEGPARRQRRAPAEPLAGIVAEQNEAVARPIARGDGVACPAIGRPWSGLGRRGGRATTPVLRRRRKAAGAAAGDRRRAPLRARRSRRGAMRVVPRCRRRVARSRGGERRIARCGLAERADS